MISCLLPKNVKNKIYNYITIVLNVVLYGWQAWSLTLKEEHRMMAFEIRVLRILGSALKNSDYGTQS
jgi:hypothetical protein